MQCLGAAREKSVAAAGVGDRRRADATPPQLLDTFGDSLKFVNSLYTRAYGCARRRVRVGCSRRAPTGASRVACRRTCRCGALSTLVSRRAHRPAQHFITRDIVYALHNKHVAAGVGCIANAAAARRYPAEFEETSSHRVRRGNDMQFAFSYMYFIRHEPANVTLRAAFDDFIDNDHDGCARSLSFAIGRRLIDVAKAHCLGTSCARWRRSSTVRRWCVRSVLVCVGVRVSSEALASQRFDDVDRLWRLLQHCEPPTNTTTSTSANATLSGDKTRRDDLKRRDEDDERDEVDERDEEELDNYYADEEADGYADASEDDAPTSRRLRVATASQRVCRR